MDVRSVSIPFSSVKGFGPHVVKVKEFYKQPVTKVATALSGYSARYSDGDHELKMLTVKVDAQIVGSVMEIDVGKVWQVDVIATLGLRDDSGNWDDAYEGEISCCLMAELGRGLPDIGGAVITDLPVVEG